jgi:FtsH-binding integral membrane protein
MHNTPRMHNTHGSLSIWFFIGVLLTAYGLLITGAGIYELASPPPNPVVLANLHAPIWWGVVLLAIGLFYFIRFFPRKH